MNRRDHCKRPFARGDSRTPPRRNRGVSLVEMLVMMSVAGVMLGTAVTLIQLMMRAERRETHAVYQGATIERAARLLREDVHAARTAELPTDEDGAVLLLQLSPAAVVRYRIDDHTLVRTRSAGDEPARETFRFLADTQLDLQVTDSDPQFVRLTIHRRPAGDVETGTSESVQHRLLVVESRVGRNHRFEGAP